MLLVRYAPKQLQLNNWFRHCHYLVSLNRKKKKNSVKVLEPAGESNTFDNLCYHLYVKKRKAISKLPPISISKMKHMLR